MTTLEILQRAKAATAALSTLTTAGKNAALVAMAEALVTNTAAILAANAADMEAAKATISPVMLDRLALTEARIAAMAEGIRQVAALPDPVGHTLSENVRADGLRICKVSVPVGVVGIIYESRPNVTRSEERRVG